MTAFQVPTYSGSASSWQPVDYRRPALTSNPATGGTATATGPQLDGGELWLIQRAVVSCTSSPATVLRLYASDASPGRLLSGTSTGNFDEADYPSGLLLLPSEQLVAVWSNAADGAVGTITLQVQVLRLAAG